MCIRDSASGGGGGKDAKADAGRSAVWKVSAMGSETNPTTQGWYIFEKEIEKLSLIHI